MPRRLMFACLLFALFAAASALACTPTGQDDTELFEAAREVFVARVVSTQLRRLTPRQCEVNAMQSEHCAYVLGRFETVEVLKGSPPRRGELRDLVTAPGNCSLGLQSGQYFVVYADTAQRWVPRQRGSFALGPYFDASARRRVGQLAAPPHPRSVPDAD